ncbi:DUF4430 domain-containing protein [Niallia taxi]|uniref:DUF4430 domain-containing protein n=1 Tax=Niallia taxi TaxID=2499688 RepID=UPI0015F73A0D|nr:DUF4430 domain-containing protein [Niallia taxi]
MKRLFFILMVTIFAVVGCNQGSDTGKEETPAPKEEQSEADQFAHIVIMKNDGEEVVEEKDAHFAKGEKLMDVMQRDFEVEHDNGFITSINGIKANEDKKESWFIKVNGEDAKVGAKELELKNEDTIEFDLHAWE